MPFIFYLIKSDKKNRDTNKRAHVKLIVINKILQKLSERKRVEFAENSRRFCVYECLMHRKPSKSVASEESDQIPGNCTFFASISDAVRCDDDVITLFDDNCLWIIVERLAYGISNMSEKTIAVRYTITLIPVVIGIWQGEIATDIKETNGIKLANHYKPSKLG